MGKNLKILAGLVLTLSVIAAATLLVVRYFDVLVRMYDNLRETVVGKKNGIFSEECCDCCVDNEEDDMLLSEEL